MNKSKTSQSKSQIPGTRAIGKYTKKIAWHECLFHFARHLNGTKWTAKHKEFYIGRGQFFCRKSKLAKRWGWSRAKIERFFARKEQEGKIIKKGIQGIGTIITIVDFEQAQEDYYK